MAEDRDKLTSVDCNTKGSCYLGKILQYYQHSAPELVELSTLVAPEPEPQLQPHPLAVERRLKPAKVGKTAMEDDNSTPLVVTWAPGDANMSKHKRAAENKGKA